MKFVTKILFLLTLAVQVFTADPGFQCLYNNSTKTQQTFRKVANSQHLVENVANSLQPDELASRQHPGRQSPLFPLTHLVGTRKQTQSTPQKPEPSGNHLLPQNSSQKTSIPSNNQKPNSSTLPTRNSRNLFQPNSISNVTNPLPHSKGNEHAISKFQEIFSNNGTQPDKARAIHIPIPRSPPGRRENQQSISPEPGSITIISGNSQMPSSSYRPVPANSGPTLTSQKRQEPLNQNGGEDKGVEKEDSTGEPNPSFSGNPINADDFKKTS